MADEDGDWMLADISMMRRMTSNAAELLQFITLPKAQQTRGLSLACQSNFLGRITSSTEILIKLQF